MAEWLGLAAIASWALLPVVIDLAHTVHIGGHWTGADGPFAADQLNYMAWARDEGNHFLASDLMQTTPSAHDYLNPMLLITGLLWRLGVGLALALLLWTPVAIAALFWGVAAYLRRLLQRSGERAAALVLALFYFVPAVPVLWWLGALGAGERDRLLAPTGQAFASGELWGYLPAAISIGMIAVCLLWGERGLLAAPGRRSGPLAVSCAAAITASWLHPWQGLTLAVILAGVLAWGPGWRSRLPLLWALAAALAPLIYYYVLQHVDPAWRAGARQNELPHYGLGSLLLALVPLLAPALAGLRAPGNDLQERCLLLWPIAGLLVYFILSPTFPGHGLIGITVPLAVLAVRGWRRLRVRSPVWAAAALLTLTVPGIVFTAQRYGAIVANGFQGGTLTGGEARAMRWIARSAVPGAVLAPGLLGAAVPPETGRLTWVGHASTTPDYYVRATAAEQLFDGRLSVVEVRALASLARVRFLLSDCRGRVRIDAQLGPLLARAVPFGCATVYQLRG